MARFQNQTKHKPCLVLAPNGVVLNQWLQAIHRNFPDLAIILAHGERPTNARFANSWVSPFGMRQAPADLRFWPKNLQYIFDE